MIRLVAHQRTCAIRQAHHRTQTIEQVVVRARGGALVDELTTVIMGVIRGSCTIGLTITAQTTIDIVGAIDLHPLVLVGTTVPKGRRTKRRHLVGIIVGDRGRDRRPTRHIPIVVVGVLDAVRNVARATGELVGRVVGVGDRAGTGHPLRGTGAVACRIVSVRKRVLMRACSIVHIGTGEPTQRVVGIGRFAVGLIDDLRTQVVGRVAVGVARQDGAGVLADDREDLARFVIGDTLRDAVGIAGLSAMIVGIVAERGGCTARLRERGQQVDRVVAVARGAPHRGERGQIAHRIEAGGDHSATR